MINSFFHALSSALKRGELLTHRGDEELAALVDWLSRDHSVSAETAPVAEEELDYSKIRALIHSCARCSNAGEKKLPYGSGANGIMILLHLPEKVRGEEMKYYRAEANELMARMVGAIQVNVSDCYITNLIKCEGGATIQPSAMFQACVDILREEIGEVNPKIVLVMGSFAPIARLSKGFPSVQWFNIEHPITILKNPELKRSAWETLKLMKTAWDKNQR